jgi:integral membrane protein
VPDFADSTTTELERKLVPLRVVALTETVTYLVLFFFWVTGNRPGRLLMGSVHGMIFLAFAAMVLGVRADMGWTWKYAIAVIVLGPIGSVMVYTRLRREGVPTTN